MREYIPQLQNDFMDNINEGILLKKYDRPLEDYITEAFQSLNIVENYKLLDWKVVYNLDDFDDSEYNRRRDRKNVKSIRYVDESYLGYLELFIKITGIIPRTTQTKSAIFRKKILLPIFDNDQNIVLKGTKYHLIYQMVDKTLYPTLNSVTIKSLMPVCVKCTRTHVVDIFDNDYQTQSYTIQIFKNMVNPFKMYCQHGIRFALNYLEVDRVIGLFPEDTDTTDARFLYFKVNDIIIKVYKDAFEKFTYVANVTTMLYELFKDKEIVTMYRDIDDLKYWGLVFGDGRENKIQSQQVFHQRLLDKTTRNELYIDENNKASIYNLIRWIIQNYHSLWKKDNLSMMNKRLRDAETIATLITAELSKRLNRPIILGDRATFDDFVRMISFSPDILIKKLHSSGMLRYEETINDMSMTSRCKVTRKGSNSLGNKSQRSISKRQRDIHYSMLGYVDVSSSSSSDPGQSLELSPFCKLHSFVFDESLEPNSFRPEWYKYLNEVPALFGEQTIVNINIDKHDDFINLTNSLQAIEDEMYIVDYTEPGTEVFGYVEAREKELDLDNI
jgi:hypothetical protein